MTNLVKILFEKDILANLYLGLEIQLKQNEEIVKINLLR